MLVYPTVEQYQLQYPILEPTVKSQYHTGQSTHLEDTVEITIELRKPTIDQLLFAIRLFNNTNLTTLSFNQSSRIKPVFHLCAMKSVKRCLLK
ncbi:hypothetical protein CEXT_410151 [Caerostris extrusa]|uniref:Uncharacterized protein n=1 Tax=Caerostris extrusa TaxID=172846 RepID=A0AAV4NRS3_CAEEX|nr:hypothetical protein CEXT_410151 [Caerostris extrusa]